MLEDGGLINSSAALAPCTVPCREIALGIRMHSIWPINRVDMFCLLMHLRDVLHLCDRHQMQFDLAVYYRGGWKASGCDILYQFGEQ
jgi:hypothetical protein